ncbi:MAG TPA: hypothetical protein VGD17_09220 [Chitinophagaceae bacterium]
MGAGSPLEFYSERIKELAGKIQVKKQQSNRVAMVRLVIVVIAAIIIYIVWGSGWEYVVVTAVVALALFLRLVSVSAKLKVELDNLQTLHLINTQEIQILNGSYSHRPDGIQFQPAHHPYSHDLDILGKASLYQYINRTTSEQGNNLMAVWLLEPAGDITIGERQEASKELLDEPEWRQQLHAHGTANPLTLAIQRSLSAWLAEPHRFRKNKTWGYLRYVLPAICLSLLLLYIFDFIQPGLFYLMLLVFFAVSSYISKLITPQYLQLSKHIPEFETLSQSLKWVESGNFKATLLQRLQVFSGALNHKTGKSFQPGHNSDQYSPSTKRGSEEVSSLKKILDRMDLRLNPLVFIPLNIFLFWDLQQVLQLEEWKEQHEDKVNDWFAAVSEMEVLSSFGNLAFNHPGWTFPVIQPEWFNLTCREAAHPLIPPTKNIANSFAMKGHPQMAFITGSNMAGKSTFLRTIGTNLVLALAGAPVNASYFETPVLKIMTSMRIADNLEESASTFYAELQKLKSIIDAVKRSAEVDRPVEVDRSPRVFILLDEILRGTNSLDRHTGSEALIKQLIKDDAVCIIASHDLSLAQLENEYPGIIHNYHFDVTIEGSELSFDYKLKQGVCRTLNATLLMKKIGIEL